MPPGSAALLDAAREQQATNHADLLEAMAKGRYLQLLRALEALSSQDRLRNRRGDGAVLGNAFSARGDRDALVGQRAMALNGQGRGPPRQPTGRRTVAPGTDPVRSVCATWPRSQPQSSAVPRTAARRAQRPGRQAPCKTFSVSCTTL